MPAYLHTAPTLEPLTLQEAKEHLRLQTALDDVAVTAAIVGARQYVEEHCWRGLVTQVWELVEPLFPDELCRPAFTQGKAEFDGFELPKGNLVSVASVKYLDGDGATQTLVANTDYLVDTVSTPGRVRLAYGAAWPSHRSQWDAVRIRYTVGWAVAAVPQPIKQAMLLLISQMYESRSPVVVEAGTTVDALLRAYRLVRHT